jgi:hypothetical protein
LRTKVDDFAMRALAALDPPAETRRQFLTLAIWCFFLASAVVAAAMVGPHVATDVDALTLDPGSYEAQSELHRARTARLKIAGLVGLVAPAICTMLFSRRYRRRGAHARGITVELTDTELRIWGRGYGSRVPFEGAELQERLVDVYAGRLGAWRQVRLRTSNKTRAIELAAPASDADAKLGLHLAGGEADCVELDREDYEALKAELRRRLRVSDLPPRAG